MKLNLQILAVMKYRLLCFVFCVLCSFLPINAEDWILAALKFDFSQNISSASEKETASLLPKLILEQVTEGVERVPLLQEIQYRNLEQLRTERLSLFLQLSKEVQTRDSLVLIEKNERRLKKKIAQANKKIKEIQDKIDENIQKAENYTKKDFKDSLASKNKPMPLKAERVALYQSDSNNLYEPSLEAIKSGVKGRKFEKEIIEAKINGLITGNIIIYSGYAAVTVSFYIYPGAKELGTVTEVGSIADCASLSQRLASSLVPLIINSHPVELRFDIQPEEALSSINIKVDGLVMQLQEDKINISSGLHTIQIASEGFSTQTFTYNFSNRDIFYIHVPMELKNTGSFYMNINPNYDGSLYANGAFISNSNFGRIEINDKPVIGQFLLPPNEEGEILGGFFYIPLEQQLDGYILAASPNVQNKTSIIEERRIWMYRGYTLFMLTLPFTFFAIGNFDSSYYGFFNGGVAAKEVYAWNTARYVTAGISIGAGGFFIFELIRYLIAANSVLPTSSKVITSSSKNEDTEKVDNEEK